MSTTRNSPAPTVEHDDFKNLADSASDIGCGQRWLRDGVNHGGFPHDRYGQALWFSRQQRDEIRAMHRVPAKPVLMRNYTAKTRKHTRTPAQTVPRQRAAA